MAATVAEHLNHEVRRAVHHRGCTEKVRCRTDETDEPYHAHHLVEIPQGQSNQGQEVDPTYAGGGLTRLDCNLRAEFTLGDRNSVDEAKLPGQKQQISCAHEAD